MTTRWTAFVVAAAMMSTPAMARPVSYEGGWTAIEESDRERTALWVHYTVNPKTSLGWRTEWNRKDDTVFNGPQLTLLAKRWFGENYQANIYGYGALGIAEGIDDNRMGPRSAGQLGVLTDWETRRWYLSYGARGAVVQNDESFMHTARVGFAPYEADTGDLHTWLMVEFDHRPENDEPTSITPLVRFFKGAALFEAGWSLADDEPLINFQYRF